MRVEKYCARWVSAVITLNGTMLAQYARVFGSAKTHPRIYNGVDLEASQATDPQRIRQEFGMEPGTFAVGTFARLVDGKGILSSLLYCRPRQQEDPHTRFFVVGGDSVRIRPLKGQDGKELADQTGLGSPTRLHGRRNDRIDIMAAMDLVLRFPPPFLGNESGAPGGNGCRQASHRDQHSGYEFCVDDGRTGFMVEPGDIQGSYRESSDPCS